MKKVSIIVPCYNQAHYLDESLQSVLEQSYDNWECIIVNDGSPDDTEIVSQSWLDKDSRFKYVYQENGGLSSARNAGIMQAVGELILPLDADDKIGKYYLTYGIEAFTNNENLKLVYCNAEKFDNQVGKWELQPFNLKNLALSNMIFCTAIYKKVDWEEAGGYDPLMRYGWEDWEFWIALLKNGGEVLKIEYLGFFYRIKQNSMILNLTENRRDELYRYISIKHAAFFVKQFGSFHKLNSDFYQLAKKHKGVISSKKLLLKHLLLFTLKSFGLKK